MNLLTKAALCAAGCMLFSAAAPAAEKTMMHCFAFTPIKTASDAEWDAFYKATDDLPKKIKGIKRVWAGKLKASLALPRLTDAEARKKFNADGKATGEAERVVREYGVCMEFADVAAFDAYGKDPAHKEWEGVYGKVRVPGTTTYQILPR